MKKQINAKFMQKFITLAADQLHGEWVIIGGTVLPLLGIDLRVTIDIDLVNLEMKNSNEQSLQLMQIAESMGLPVEAINQAGAYFLSKIEDVREHLVILKETKKCKIFRPDVYLFLKLKIARLSESDLEDCMAMIKHHPEELQQNRKDILILLKKSNKTDSIDVKNRLQTIYDACK